MSEDIKLVDIDSINKYWDIKVIKKYSDSFVTKETFTELSTSTIWHEELISLKDGTKVKINRKMAYISDDGEKDYTYAGLSFPGQSWHSNTLLAMCDRLRKDCSYGFNSVLLNLYKDGKDEIKWHSDKEECLGENPVIACINLGATRKFWFRKKEPMSEKFFYEVEDGDLLIMGENCQKNYLHAILKEKEVTEPRISLTFRKCL